MTHKSTLTAHATASAHHEAPHGEVGTLLRAYEHLSRGSRAGFHFHGRDGIDVSYGHEEPQQLTVIAGTHGESTDGAGKLPRLPRRREARV